MSENTFIKVLLYIQLYPAILVYKIKVFFYTMMHSVLTVAFSVLYQIQKKTTIILKSIQNCEKVFCFTLFLKGLYTRLLLFYFIKSKIE